MPNGTLSDHDLLVRIDERVHTISSDYVTEKELKSGIDNTKSMIASAVVTHERKLHKGVSWALIGQILTTLILAGLALWKMLG